MIDGSMQSYGLTLDKFLSHAAKWHPDAEVVSGAADGGIRRISYAALHDRARGVSGALAALGIGPGDRVATLAWNTQGHVEAWYGIMGMGAVCHRSEEHTSELQSLMRISYAVFCLKKKIQLHMNILTNKRLSRLNYTQYT